MKVGAYKGSVFFLSMSGVQKSLYNEADSSMEASDGLNPVSSQGYAEVQSVEARMMALAGQVYIHPTTADGKTAASASPGAKRPCLAFFAVRSSRPTSELLTSALSCSPKSAPGADLPAPTTGVEGG